MLLGRRAQFGLGACYDTIVRIPATGMFRGGEEDSAFKCGGVAHTSVRMSETTRRTPGPSHRWGFDRVHGRVHCVSLVALRIDALDRLNG